MCSAIENMANSVVALLIYKIASVMAGVFITWMGFRLFELGVFKSTTDVDATLGNSRLLLKRAAPGTIFAIIGVAVVLASVWKGFAVGSEKPSLRDQVPGRITTDMPHVNGAGTLASSDLDTAQAINTILAATATERSRPDAPKSLVLAGEYLKELRARLALEQVTDRDLELYNQYKNVPIEALSALKETDRESIIRVRHWYEMVFTN